jgi:hypothetical protein
LPPGAKPEPGRTVAGQTTKPPVATQKTKPVFDPKVQALQQQLIAKGAKIKADGFMGDQTRIAMKQFGTGSPVATQPVPAPAVVPPGINPETGQKYNDGTTAPLQLPPGAKPEPAARPIHSGSLPPPNRVREDAELTAMLRIAGLR